MSELPRLHTPEALGKTLGRSGWWVREQCRRGLFPHTRAGGAIRLTDSQVAEILRILERRPDQGQQQGRGATTGRRRTQKQPAEQVVQLRARQPRRSRDTG